MEGHEVEDKDCERWPWGGEDWEGRIGGGIRILHKGSGLLIWGLGWRVLFGGVGK